VRAGGGRSIFHIPAERVGGEKEEKKTLRKKEKGGGGTIGEKCYVVGRQKERVRRKRKGRSLRGGWEGRKEANGTAV